MRHARLRRFFPFAVLVIAAGVVVAGSPRVSAADANASATVEMDGRPVLVVRSAPAGVTVEERASLIGQRLSVVAHTPRIRIEEIQLRNVDDATEIVAGDFVLMHVTDADGAAAGRPRSVIASEYSGRMRDAILRFRAARSWRSRALETLSAVLTTAVFLGCLVALRRLHRRANAEIERRRVSRTLAIRVQSIEVLRGDRLASLLTRGAAGARWGLALLLLYAYVTRVLGFFPETQGLWRILRGLLLAPLAAIWDGFIAYLPSLLFVAVIAFLAYLAVRLSDFIFSEIDRGTVILQGFHRDLARPTAKIVRGAVLAMALVAAFPYLPGSRSPAFQGVSILLGVLLSLGSSSAVANMISGVILIYMRPFQPGDRVDIAGNVGDVVEKSLLVTRIRTVKNVIVTIPNATVMGSHILNYSAPAREAGLILHTTVTIGYDAPWRTVHELLIAAARRTPGILSDPAPFVLQTALNDFYVSYELNAYTAEANRIAEIYSGLHANIQDAFNEGGVEINSPHYRAIRDGNQITIPASYVPAEYRPPAFRFAPDGQPVGERQTKAAGVPAE